MIFPILLVLYEVATYLSNDMYLPALPQMMHDLGMSSSQAQLTLTYWFVGSAMLPIFMGVVSDFFGRKKTLLTGGIIYIAATLVCATTSDTTALLIARFLEGATIPSMFVTGYACIHELYEEKEAIRILAIMGSIVILAPAVGPLLGAGVLYLTNWRGIFWFIAIASSIIILLLSKWMPETQTPQNKTSINPRILLKQYARLLSNKQFMLLNGVAGFIYTGFICWIASGPLLVINSYQYTPFVFALFQACVFAAFIAGNHQVTILLKKIEVKTMIYRGLIITLTGGMLGLLAAYFSAGTLYPFIIAMTLFSYGAALCSAPLNRSIIETSDEPMNARMALFTTLWTGFAALGSLIAGVAFNGALSSIAIPISLAISISCLLMLIKIKWQTEK
jgi:DHA1 family multidrug/chloramphenicol efflux transport protein-like MFS transporter